MIRSKSRQVVLIISTFLSILYMIYSWKWAVFCAPIFGICGIFSSRFCILVNYVWDKLIQALGFLSSHLLLMIIYYFVLFPLSLLSRLFRKDKDPLMLSRRHASYFTSEKKEYDKSDLERPW